MQLLIRVTFSNHPDQESLPDFQLNWRLRNHSLAFRFLEALRVATSLEQKTGYMYKRDRFYNFPQGYYSKEKVIELLHQNVTIINQAYPGLIDQKIHSEMNQEEMNKLHTYFEKHRGSLLNPSKYYTNGSTQVRIAFNEVNLLIHRFEDCGFAHQADPVGNARFVAAFGLHGEIQRHPLEDEDYQLFDLDNPYGCMMLNYCEVGKHLMEVFYDQDQEIGADAILPLRYNSADFFVEFRPNFHKEDAERVLSDFYRWWDEHETQLQSLGFQKYDKKNAIGEITLADLQTELSHEQLIHELSARQWISKVELLEL